jgi:hypothetical protein
LGSKNSNGRRKTLALLATTTTLAGGLTAGTAWAGGGGDQGGTGGGGSAAQFWAYKDDATGSWGFRDGPEQREPRHGLERRDHGRFGRQGRQGVERRERGMRGRLPPEASGRGRRRLPRRGRGRRPATGPPPACGNGSGVYDAKIWKDNWYKNIAPNEYLYAGSQHYHTGDGFSDDLSNSVDKIMERHVDSTRSIVVIVLDKYQLAPPDYTLSVATKASGTTTKAGDTQNVADTVTTSRNGSSISENVTGTSTLRWTGVDGTTHNTWNGDTEVTAEGYYYASEDETILQPVARKDGETVDQITSTLR